MPATSNMDAIENMAHRITYYCMAALDNVDRIQCILDQSETAGEALDLLVQSAIIPSGDYVHLKTIRDDAPRLQLCLDRMQDIKNLARKAFEVNYPDTVTQGPVYVFNQEVCFSYASKMLVSLGPLLQHYSNKPTKNMVIDAELAIAMKTPIYVDDDHADDESFRERKTTLSMPSSVRETAKNIVPEKNNNALVRQKNARERRVSEPVGDLLLLCKEEMTDASFTHNVPRQTRQSRPPLPARSCQRLVITLCKGQANTLLPPPPK